MVIERIKDNKELIEMLLKESYQKRETETDSEEVKYYTFVIKELEEAKEQVNLKNEYIERLNNLNEIAIDILEQCGLCGLHKAKVSIDMEEHKTRNGYYIVDTNMIFVHKHTLDENKDFRIIDVILHEYLHYWIDKNFGSINEETCCDDSIIFSLMAHRINKKLEKINDDNYIFQNKNNELNYEFLFKDLEKARAFTDLRKNIKTVKSEIVNIINDVMEKFGTLLLLSDEMIDKFNSGLDYNF